jgi:hypothetical protein
MGGEEEEVSIPVEHTPIRPPTGENRFVLANGGLNVRAAADDKAAVVVQVPQEATVLVTGIPQAMATVDGIVGGWVPVWYQGKSGYAFSGFLADWPLPPASCGSLQDWATRIGTMGAEVLVDNQSCPPEMPYCDMAMRRYETKLLGGYSFQRAEYYESATQTLTLKKTVLGSAWLGARRCEPDLSAIKLSSMSLPLKSTLLNVPAEPYPYSVEISVSPNRIGFDWGFGASCWLYLEQKGPDVEIVSGCGA